MKINVFRVYVHRREIAALISEIEAIVLQLYGENGDKFSPLQEVWHKLRWLVQG